MCSLCRLPVAKNHNFGQIFDIFGGSCTDPLLPMRAKFGELSAKFRLDRFILSSCGGEKPQFLPFVAVFWTSAFSDVTNCHQSQKVEHGCTTATFPYPKASKSFLYSNAFMATSGAQSLTFKSVTDKQTDRRTDRQKKTQRFWPPRRRVKSEPHQTWHDDRGP